MLAVNSNSIAAPFVCVRVKGAYRQLCTSDRCKQAASQLTRETLKRWGGTKLSSFCKLCLSHVLFPPSLCLPHTHAHTPTYSQELGKEILYSSPQCYTEASLRQKPGNQSTLFKQPIKRRQGELKHLLKTYHYSILYILVQGRPNEHKPLRSAAKNHYTHSRLKRWLLNVL